jgi:hypothetical protein
MDSAIVIRNDVEYINGTVVITSAFSVHEYGYILDLTAADGFDRWCQQGGSFIKSTGTYGAQVWYIYLDIDL